MKKMQENNQIFDFITVGSATQDIMYYTGGGSVVKQEEAGESFDSLAFRLGAKFEIEKTYFNYGGGANNTAVSLAKLGFNVGTVMAIGDDYFSKELEVYLGKNKIKTGFIQKVKNNTLGLSVVVNSKQDRRYVIFTSRAANAKLNFVAKNYQKMQTKWLYFNSLNFTGWQKNFTEILKYKKNNPATKIHWNPGSYQIKAGVKKLKPLLLLTETLQVNLDEAICLLENKITGDVEKIIKAVYALGPKIVVVTSGRNGSYCYDGKNLYHEPASSHKSVDTTGAGDAFGSGFAGGLLFSDGDVATALKFGALNSGSVVSEIGAHNGLLSRKEILKKIKI